MENLAAYSVPQPRLPRSIPPPSRYLLLYDLRICFPQVFQEVMPSDFMSVDSVTYPLLKFVSTLLLGSFNGISRDRHHKQLISKVFNTVDSFEPLFTFCRHLLAWENFNKDILPSLLNCCQSELLKTSCNIQEVVQMLTEVILHSIEADSSGLELGSLQGLLFFPKCGTKQGKQILQSLLDNLTADQDTLMDNSRLSVIWGTLVCIPCIRWVITKSLVNKLSVCFQCYDSEKSKVMLVMHNYLVSCIRNLAV